MSRDSSGAYSRVVSSYVNGTVADADDVNAEMDDLGAEITASLEASGKKTWTGTQNANGYGIKTLANLKVHTTSGGTTAYTVTTGATFTAYSQLPIIAVLWNATNTGSSTLNVDAVGAKTIKKGGTTNVAAGDLVSGNVSLLAYDGTYLQLISADTSQALDATLTALAALSWSSNSPVIQFTAADTVSLTNTPTFTSTAASTAAVTAKNTTNNASVTGLTVKGARATPTAFDNVTLNFELNNGSGTAKIFGNILIYAAVVTAGSESGRMDLQLMNGSGTLTGYLTLVPTALQPVTNDGLALGSATLSWSDLFLASGGVINFNNGAFTLTQSGSNLAASGSIQARVPVSSETTGTLTTASANKKVVCTGGITIPTSVFSADDFVLFDPGTSSRTFTRGTTNMYVNGTDVGTATLASNQFGTVHFRSATVAVCAGAFS